MKIENNTVFSIHQNLGQIPVGEPVYCGVCGAKTIANRGILGPMSYADSVSKIDRLHDHFICPDSEADWHKRVVELRIEANSFKSKILQNFVLAEAEGILISKTCISG